MAAEARRVINRPGELAALAHPLRLDLLNHLMAGGPATASRCARAVGDTPSNCSYHLRYLARHGLVAPVEDAEGDNRERPWRALITGFDTDPEHAQTLAAIVLERDHRLAREYLARRDSVDPAWREAGELATYTLRLTPAELAALNGKLDALIRPYIAATRDREADEEQAQLVHLGLKAFVLETER